MDHKIKLTFCSGVGTVTGANFLVEAGDYKILVDCGMVQGEEFATEENGKPFIYDPTSIDTLIVTHAHLDHVGRIPKLVKEGFKGTIYSTPETKELASLVLYDAVNILREEAERNNSAVLYEENDVNAVFPLWQTVPYHQVQKISDLIAFSMKDAGHILGSAMIELSIGEKKMLFTGDVGNSPAPLLRDTESVGDVDFMIMESTYGNKNHEPKEERLREFERIVNEALDRGGTLIIPAFSIDRTQVLLYELNNMVEEGRIKKVPVFVDSPMAIKATQIYAGNTNLFNDTVKKQIEKGDNVFAFPHLEYTVTEGESRAIGKVHGPKIILAGSGMSVGGRVIGHEAELLPDPKNTLLLVGYQTAGSLGRRLAEGEKRVNIHGKKIHVKAKIETLYGFSAHKDSDHLVDFVATASNRLKKVFVAMGEPVASMFLAQRLNNELELEAFMPERGRVYEL